MFERPQHPYTRALLAAEPKRDPAPLQPDAPVVVETHDLKVWFPIKRGVLRKVVGHIKAVDGVSIAVRKGETLGMVGESGSGKTTLGLAILRLISSDGPIVFMGKTIQGLKFKEMRPFRRDMQIVFQDPYGSLSPRMSVVRHHRGRAVGAPAADDARGARGAGDRARCATSGSIPRRASAIRTNSPAASASASRWRARSCWSRPSSCWTSRPARSTC